MSSFAQKYSEKHPGVDAEDMAKRLWGDWYFDEETRRFTRTKPAGGGIRTFVQFVLDPLYKIYSQVIGENPEELQVTLKRLGIRLTSKEVHMDSKPLLKLVLSKFFGNPRGFVNMICTHVPSPIDAADARLSVGYTGSLTSATARAMQKCSPAGPLMIHVVKLISDPEGVKFSSLGRVYSGSVSVGDRVKVCILLNY